MLVVLHTVLLLQQFTILGAASLKPSPQKTYLNHRNSLWMLLKNVPAKQLFPVVFCSRMVLDGFAAFRYLSLGNLMSFSMVIKAMLKFTPNCFTPSKKKLHGKAKGLFPT